MYEELNRIFPNQWWFYEVVGLTLTEAMDRCARMTGQQAHVVNYQGKIVFASVDEIDTSVSWLSLIGGPVQNSSEEAQLNG